MSGKVKETRLLVKTEKQINTKWHISIFFCCCLYITTLSKLSAVTNDFFPPESYSCQILNQITFIQVPGVTSLARQWMVSYLASWRGFLSYPPPLLWCSSGVHQAVFGPLPFHFLGKVITIDFSTPLMYMTLSSFCNLFL